MAWHRCSPGQDNDDNFKDDIEFSKFINEVLFQNFATSNEPPDNETNYFLFKLLSNWLPEAIESQKIYPRGLHALCCLFEHYNMLHSWKQTWKLFSLVKKSDNLLEYFVDRVMKTADESDKKSKKLKCLTHELMRRIFD